ncbi:signal recognition particle-docking protein FtsY [Campylobacter troglodytis]|uniref:signal recognition particle-docking protein FtsY n=1 Tax=Campylobacter troglodytis TaxID=654363 RepID=UPI00115C1956|nr:signal recognition particle-docking protein FtsY [Campylobacter troglodytis]TQR61097.1 signal recognition particle-docking protein FtsY [Campylobacter troglodytis]
MLDFLKKGLSKTVASMNLIKKGEKISKDLLEEMLLEADVSYEIVEEVIYYLPPSKEIKKEDLKRVLNTYFIYEEAATKPSKPFVELILGVNGAGKTTTVAKLANLYKNQAQTVILGACDTFRAGAIEQLRLWAKKLELEIVLSSQGHDPSAVAFDAISKAVAKGFDRVILDTAGRLQNQKNLNAELEKISRICDKAMQGAPHRKILVLDGTQGNAGILQAKAFNELIKLDGIIITKLDGTAKGGALFSVARELELPILFIGVGEGVEDLIHFKAEDYVNSLVSSIFTE